MPLKQQVLVLSRLARALVAPWWKTWFNNERETIGVTPWTTRFWDNDATANLNMSWSNTSQKTYMALSSFIWHFGKWRVAPKLWIYFKNIAANREGQSKQYDVQKSTPQGHHGTSCETAMFSISKPMHNEVKFRASAERKIGLVLVAVHQKNGEHVRIIILPMEFFFEC